MKRACVLLVVLAAFACQANRVTSAPIVLNLGNLTSTGTYFDLNMGGGPDRYEQDGFRLQVGNPGHNFDMLVDHMHLVSPAPEPLVLTRIDGGAFDLLSITSTAEGPIRVVSSAGTIIFPASFGVLPANLNGITSASFDVSGARGNFAGMFAVTVQQAEVIPEPASVTLLAAGIVGLACFRLRRNRHAAPV